MNKRIANAATTAAETALPLQVKFLPLQAHWFTLDALLLANQANRDGMHANALSLTRQCVEAISVLEVAISGHADAGDVLTKWDDDGLSQGELRKWLSQNVWPRYGNGMWTEPWAEFMAQFAKAIQPYAHYSTHLAKWQWRLHGKSDPAKDNVVLAEIGPRAYDPQKATRITLFHSIVGFALARIWMASASRNDPEFAALANRLRVALGKSKYLDGHQTNWAEQFWAMVWSRHGGTILE